MFKFTKLAFIALLNFRGSLAQIAKVSDTIKWISLNDELCLARSNLIYLNLNELHCYQFMVSLDRSNRSCNTFDD